MRIDLCAAALAVAAALSACKASDGGTGSSDQCPQGDGATATPVDLAVGQSARLLDAAANACVRFSTGSRYLVTVANTNQNPTQSVGFQLVGNGGSATASVAPPYDGAVVSAAQLFGDPGRDAASVDAGRRRLAAHARMLALEERLTRGMPTPRAAWSAERARRRALGVSLAMGPGPAGSVQEVRILNRDNIGGSQCSNVNFLSITARTVYVGTRSIVLEDTLSPLARQMDTAYTRLAQEFDTGMFPILQSYYGNPLAMDPELDANGKVVMVFSPRINDFGDIAGFVLNCDFFPRASAGVSNEGEYFYALVPDSLGTGIASWDKSIRSTLIHEVKHVTSNAERFVNPAADDLEARWLEEATAMHAEEIWARTQFGTAWKSNQTYAQTLFCERRFGIASNPQCRGKPLVMFSHYSLLYDYLEAPERTTPLGAVDDDDFLFYGSGWSLVRWVADQYATTEQAFFKGMTQSADVGVANLAGRAGHPWPELLADWSAAIALDDRAGFTPGSDVLKILTWNTRDVFAGMNSELPTSFPRDFPLRPRPVTFGSFTQTVTQLRSGSFAAFELSGAAGTAQTLELRSSTGAAAAPVALIMNVVRIQ